MKDYPRCKTCRWWKEGSYYIKVSDVDCDWHEVDASYVTDWTCSAPYGPVRIHSPGPSFGCIHHEPKESE